MDASAHDARACAPAGHVRIFAGEGCLFTLGWADTRVARHTASLCVALGDAQLRLRTPERTLRCKAVALRPFCEFAFDSGGAPFACIDLLPTAPAYRLFTRIDGDGLLPLADSHAGLRGRLREFHGGGMGAADAYRVFRQAVEFGAARLPPVPPPDGRVREALWRLYRSPELALGTLAQGLGLSADRLSRLFAREMGFTLRRYLQALKVMAAGRYYGSGKSLTEIAVAAGFADLAHFSKVWRRCYGSPPAYYFRSGALRAWPAGCEPVVLWDPGRMPP